MSGPAFKSSVIRLSVRVGLAVAGSLAFGATLWALANDLRWGGYGWSPGPTAGSQRALAQAAIFETVVMAALAFVTGFDGLGGGRPTPSRVRRRELIPAKALVTPGAVILLTCAIAVGASRSPWSWAPIVPAQIAVLASASFSGALGMLLRSRVENRGAGVASGALVLAGWFSTIFLAGPYAGWLSRHPRFLEAVFAVDPVITVTRLLGVDHLRGERIYRLTDLGTYPFAYPPALAGVCFQLTLAVAFWSFSRPSRHETGEKV